MASVPELHAGSLRLVPFRHDHLSQAYVGWLNDPAVVRYSEQRHHAHTPDTCRAFVRSFDAGPNQLWAIEQDEAGGHVGNITATHDVHNRLCDIGILIGARKARGRGLGRLAWQTVLDHLCTRPDLRKITGGCLAPNGAMVRIMERCGMRRDGRRPAHYLLEGLPTDLLYYARDVQADQGGPPDFRTGAFR